MSHPLHIRFYNTLTHRVEPFAPIAAPDVTMYNCGPTVYDFAHIGNFRAFVFADVLRRFLELVGLRVQQVMNLTDVGHMTEDQLADGGGIDKMQAAAQRLKEAKKSGNVTAGTAGISNPDDPYQVAQFYINAFLEDARALGVKVAHEFTQDPTTTRMPRATDHVPRMIELITRLIATGHAYVAADGAVYYRVESFPDYGALSGNTLDKLRAGSGGRVLDEHQAVKRHPADFLLWKPDATHLMKWDSPWGQGYPGWHIECSAMAMAVLGREVIDIHTGGEDNIFPHHECEIAQSRGCTGREHFARFWMHTRFLLVEGEKMSKSKGNFFTVRDVIAGRATGRPVDPAVLRYELLRSHYRSNMNFTTKGLEDSAGAVRKLRDAAAAFAQEAGGMEATDVAGHAVLTQFTESLADDLNMSGALGAVFKWLAEPRDTPDVSLTVLRRIDSVLGVLPADGALRSRADDDNVAIDKCHGIDAARKARDFTTADRLRQELIDAGYDVMTTKQGTTAKKKLA